jgi:FkbM family methyltransferase
MIDPSQSIGSPRPRRILLGQLGARGDCIYATAVARQIKEDYPECHLTWAIGSMARGVIANNPHVDELWEFPVRNHDEMLPAWERFRKELAARQARGDFDDVFLTQVFPDNFANYDGTVRASIFRGYPRPITVPVTPVIRLSREQVDATAKFVAEHRLASFSTVILFECASASGQSFVTPGFALEVARGIVAICPDAAVVLSSSESVTSGDPRIIDGSTLSFECNAELTKSCSLLIGCSSGISWLATSDWAKPLPKIQLLRCATSVFASFVHDHEYFGLPTNQIIEMTDCPAERVIECVAMIGEKGFAEARRTFHEKIELKFDYYIYILSVGFRRGGWPVVMRSLGNIVSRYGFRPELLATAFRVARKKLALWNRLHRLIGKAFGIQVLRVRDLERYLNIENSYQLRDRRVLELESAYEAVRLSRDHAQELSNMLKMRVAELETSGQPPTYPFPVLPGVDPKWLNVSIVDVGAEPLAFERDVYEPMLHEGRHSIIGFDPFANAAIPRSNRTAEARDARVAFPNVEFKVLPYFVGSGNTQTFHVNHFSPTSSLFPSNLPLLQQFKHLAEICATVRKVEVATQRLDDVGEIEQCDFLKVDVQGGDYDVLASGRRTLAKTLFVHIEAEFAPIYEGQPLFRDIDALLQEQGFDLIDLVKLGRNSYTAFPSSRVKSRLLWSDVIYMKSPDMISARDPNLLIRAAYIAHSNYRKYDLAAHLVHQYDLRHGTRYRDIYVKTLESGATQLEGVADQT